MEHTHLLSDQIVDRLIGGEEVFLDTTPQSDGGQPTNSSTMKCWIAEGMLFVSTTRNCEETPVVSKYRLEHVTGAEIKREFDKHVCSVGKSAVAKVASKAPEEQKETLPFPREQTTQGKDTLGGEFSVGAMRVSSVPMGMESVTTDKDPVNTKLLDPVGTGQSELTAGGVRRGNEIGRSDNIFKDMGESWSGTPNYFGYDPRTGDIRPPMSLGEYVRPRPYNTQRGNLNINGLDDMDIMSGLPDGTFLGGYQAGSMRGGNRRPGPAIPPGARFDPFGPQRRNDFGPAGGLPPF